MNLKLFYYQKKSPKFLSKQVAEMAEHLKKKPTYHATSGSTSWAPTEIELHEIVRKAVLEAMGEFRG